MFLRKPNQHFIVMFRSRHKGLDSSAFNVFCENTQGFTPVEQSLAVSEVQRGGQPSGDYYVSGLVFQDEGEYLLSIEIPAHGVVLKAAISIREEVASGGDSGETFGIIY